MNKSVFDKYKQIFEKSSPNTKNSNESNIKRKIIVTKIPIKNEGDENQKNCTNGRLNSVSIQRSEIPPTNTVINNKKNTSNINYCKKVSTNLDSKTINTISKTSRTHQSCEDIPIVIISSNKKAENNVKSNGNTNDNSAKKKITNNKNDSSKTLEVINSKYYKIPHKRQQSTINENTFNRLHDLQILIKKESALKELCKLILYNI